MTPPIEPSASASDTAHSFTNTAATELIGSLAERGIETTFDRIAMQLPQCKFGLDGTCCRMCQWGPCKITAKSPRGVCGRSAELIVMANLVRAITAGASAQMMHAREMALTLGAAARHEIALEIKGKERLREVGQVLNVAQSWDTREQIAENVAEALLEDLGRLGPGRTRGMGFAPRDKLRQWEELGIVPRSAAYEIVESMHMTTMGACSDPEALFAQALRTSLAHIYTSLVPSALLSDILFGVPEPRVADVNYGVLKADHVNVLVHGHSAIMLEKVLEALNSEEIQTLAREKGANGIVVGGMCCTGHEALSRHGIPTVTGSSGQELVMGTGAIDAVVVDMQCVLPGMVEVAKCFGTEIVTTCHSNRIPGAAHIPFDPEKPETLEDDAMRIARLAVESFAKRDRSNIHIPEKTTRVMTGFTYDTIVRSLGGIRRLTANLESGEIRGIAAMVGCSTPKVANESGHVHLARQLIKDGVLVLTSGCSAHALINAGLCDTSSAELASPGLRAVCEDAGVPPVLVVGSCADNTRIIQVFAALAHRTEEQLSELPFVVCGPELANEKTMGQVFGALAHGISAVLGFAPQLPLPATVAGEPAPEGSDARSEIAAFFGDGGMRELLGSRLLVQPDPVLAAGVVVAEMDARRELLGWCS